MTRVQGGNVNKAAGAWAQKVETESKAALQAANAVFKAFEKGDFAAPLTRSMKQAFEKSLDVLGELLTQRFDAPLDGKALKSLQRAAANVEKATELGGGGMKGVRVGMSLDNRVAQEQPPAAAAGRGGLPDGMLTGMLKTLRTELSGTPLEKEFNALMTVAPDLRARRDGGKYFLEGGPMLVQPAAMRAIYATGSGASLKEAFQELVSTMKDPSARLGGWVANAPVVNRFTYDEKNGVYQQHTGNGPGKASASR